MARCHRDAFTLVELLVVVAIIAVLVSMLLPSLNKARMSAQGLVCLANLRQLSQAARMYSNDNRGVFTFEYNLPSGATYWYDQMITGGKATAADRFVYDDTSKLGAAYISFNTIKSVRSCPLLQPDQWTEAKLNAQEHTGGHRYGFSYMDTAPPGPYMKYYFQDYIPNQTVNPNSSKFARMSRMKSTDIFLADTVFYYTNAFGQWAYFEKNASSRNVAVQSRHNNGVNAAFGDGSAARIPIADLRQYKINCYRPYLNPGSPLYTGILPTP